MAKITLLERRSEAHPKADGAREKKMNRSHMYKSFAARCAAMIAIAVVSSPAAHAATVTGTFEVQIQIQKSCSVTAGAGSNLDLGTVASTATDSAGSSSISVTCTKNTPYFIGLAPSAQNEGTNTGTGSMASTGGVPGNNDKVPYQLRSTAGSSGQVWGNTATSSTVGNGVPGTGNGAVQAYTVYATVADANYTPDAYADTVTVAVNY